jgi:hypothetical protein
MNKTPFLPMYGHRPTKLGFENGRDNQLDARNAPMNSEVKTEDELQAIIDRLPDQHNPALYGAVILDKFNKKISTKFIRARSPEQARLLALKKCRFGLQLKQAAYANVEMISCRSSAYSG